MIQVLMPMGGEGNRFLKAGYHTPKPLIKVKGKYLYEWAIFSLEGINYQLTIITKNLKGFDVKAELVQLDLPTQGPLASCLCAESKIKSKEPLLILDCDLFFRSKGLMEYMNKVYEGWEGGALLTFPSTKPCYSFVEIKDKKAVRTAEKECISDNAIAGGYFFTKAEYFFSAGKKVLLKNNPINGEYYVSQAYNELIMSGLDVCVFPMEEYKSIGTPEELVLF